MATTTGAKSATITFNPQNQNLDTVHKIVASIIGKTGCTTCGRLLNLQIQFQGDPGPDLAKQGVISVQTEGF
jgi:hypothetical protein